ncbi:MAG: pyruvate ferredoxin oxidoreductase [Proteobacteria bacterium]|nr:MAG: pyruvate ferredoxin oxidoreductase [Pseudomonadota bacterium]
MRQALEGSLAVARAVGLCRPQVVSAYPITPQTHIVENIAKLVADGEIDAELVSVESEFSAASVALGAAAAGSRAYTATSSQGILLMSEVLYNIAGMRVPLVMTCANRALGAPISIWNDHQDSMAVRDAGWIQLYCADNQEAVDTTIQAYRIAESVELPVMVCVDGFTLTHTMEIVDLPAPSAVDDFLPAYRFSRVLDPSEPRTLGTLVTPEHFTEVRYTHHNDLLAAAPVIEACDREWATRVGRESGGLVRSFGDDTARIGVLALGSIVGTLRAAVAERGETDGVRLIQLRCLRPFPTDALRTVCAGLDEVIVVERALSPGQGGIVGTEVRAAFAGVEGAPRIHNVAVGLGGRNVPIELLARLLEALPDLRGESFRIFDLNSEHLPSEDAG